MLNQRENWISCFMNIKIRLIFGYHITWIWLLVRWVTISLAMKAHKELVGFTPKINQWVNQTLVPDFLSYHFIQPIPRHHTGLSLCRYSLRLCTVLLARQFPCWWYPLDTSCSTPILGSLSVNEDWNGGPESEGTSIDATKLFLFCVRKYSRLYCLNSCLFNYKKPCSTINCHNVVLICNLCKIQIKDIKWSKTIQVNFSLMR